VYGAILAAIHEGRIRPGEKLVIEEIARELGVSRTPVREALGALSAEGLVELSPHKGAFLKDITVSELSDAYEIHALLEGYAAERAASGPQAVALVPRLRANVDALAQAVEQHATASGSVEHLMVLNEEFHALIHQASGNRVISRLIAHLTNQPKAFGRSYWDEPSAQRQSLDAHVQTLDAIASHDAKRAGDVMRKHILESRQLVLGRLRENLLRPMRQESPGVHSAGDRQGRLEDDPASAHAGQSERAKTGRHG